MKNERKGIIRGQVWRQMCEKQSKRDCKDLKYERRKKRRKRRLRLRVEYSV